MLRSRKSLPAALRRSLLGLALPGLVAGAAHAQIPEIPDWDGAARFELVSSQSAVRPGDRFEIAVVAELEPGYHLYGPEEPPPTGTVVEFQESAAFQPDAVSYPAPIRRDLSGLGEFDLYEGRVAIRVPLTSGAADSGTTEASVLVKYQLCTDNACSAPTSTTLSLDLPLARAGSSVNALHADIFGESR